MKSNKRYGSMKFDKNDREWYLKYNDITPARNENRPMQPRFNKRITNEAALGSVARFVDVNMQWSHFADSYMFKQVCNNSYQKIRQDLRSNLPYDVDVIERYITNSIALAIMAKQFERDIHWTNYTDPSVTNWMEMYSLIAPGGTYGIAPLEVDPRIGNPMSDTDWAHKVSLYDLSATIIRNSLKLPVSLKAFIDHYFGSLFVSQTDGHNDQYIRILMHDVDYYVRDDENNKWILDTMDVSKISVSSFNDMIVQHNTEYGMIIADLNKSGQLEFVDMKDYKDWDYTTVYDPTFLQALINGYTSDSAITPDKFVRLDRMQEASDEFTQFIFMGGLYTSAVDNTIDNDPTRVSPIAINNMVIKFDSDSDLKWPAALSQGVGSNDGFITFSSPFGLMVSSDIQSDTIIKVALDSGVNYVTPGELDGVKFADFASGPDVTMNVDKGKFTGPKVTIMSDSSVRHLMFLPLYGTVRTVENNNKYHYYIEYFGWAFSFNLTSSVTNKVIDAVYPAVGKVDFELGFKEIPAASLQEWGKYWYYMAQKTDFNPGSTYTLATTTDDNELELRITLGNAVVNQSGVAFTITATKSFGSLYNYNISINFTESQIALDRGSFTVIPSTSSASDTVNYIAAASPLANRASIAYITYEKANASDSMSVVDGFSSLAAWFVDQFDYHLPIFTTHKTTVSVYNGDDMVIESQETSGRALLKEAYIPYYYNVLDLLPTVYNMLFSLFETINPKSLQSKRKQDKVSFKRNSDKGKKDRK